MRLVLALFIASVAVITLPSLLTAQELETETARLLPAGWIKLGTAFEAQNSSLGQEYAIPAVLEVGIADRLQLTIEPVPYTRIAPKAGPAVTDIGDLEGTISYLLFPEVQAWPAIAVAAEIKVPTAKNRLIGTGKADYAFYLIASKRFGALDVHINGNYTIVGSPEGANLQNTFFYAAAAWYELSKRFSIFGEVYGNTPSAPDALNAESAASPEASGGELVASLGAAYAMIPNFKLSLSTSIDNQSAVLFRTALSYEFNAW